jgi:hypothetical protein
LSLLFDADPITAIRKIWHEDTDGRVHLQTEHDVTDIVEDAKGFHNLHDERSPWKGDMHRVASIPMPLFMELQKQGIIDDQKAFKRWLNERDNRVFRTRPGRV